MKRRRAPISQTSKVRRQRDPIPWKYCVLTVVCGLILTAGFFAAARQHFTSVDIAMKNADLRLEINNLNDQKRKLIVEKERASSPSQVTKLAKNIGFTPHPGRIVTAPAAQPNSAKDDSPVYSYTSTNAVSPPSAKPAVIKTVDPNPVKVKKAEVTDAEKITVDQLAVLKEWDEMNKDR